MGSPDVPGSMVAMEPLDMTSLVLYDEQDQIVGVKEFQLAKALLEGHKEELGQLLPSQWGMVHLFDLCLWFGLIDTASALALRGVTACILDDHHHLGPFSSRDSPSRRGLPCSCQGWETCRYCCWAFPVEKGIWMEDWDVDLGRAISAAREASATPLTRAMLDLCSRDIEHSFSGSPKAMARLLDIAILTGNQKATVNLSKKCQVRPLRRWSMEWDSENCCWEAARTALWAGADFQDLMVEDRLLDCEDVPFPQALFLKSELEDWQEIRHLLPRCHDLLRPRTLNNNLGPFFWERHGPDAGKKLSLDKIRSAEDAGVDLRFCFAQVICPGVDDDYVPVTLLDMAIWYGQPKCAEACVDGGIELKGDDGTWAWHKRVLRGGSLSLLDPALDVVPSEAQTAAAAAGCAWLKRLWKSESSQKGIVLYQFMLKMFKGRSFPMVLVQEILAFSTTVPKIIDQLDLWEHVGDWMASICCGPFAPAAADVDGMDVKVESGGLEGPCASDELQLCSTAELHAAAESGPVSSDAKSTDELMMALQASRDEIPALNIDGVCLFRLTRNAKCPRVTALLLDPTGPLASLHQRVWEAGGQVNPEWNPVKVLFVPITEAQMDELQGLSEQGYELSKEYHLLALQSDENLIVEAIRSNMPYKNRPKLKKVGPEVSVPGADERDQDVYDEEDGPLLVLEAGIRTDSSVGFPSYPTDSQ